MSKISTSEDFRKALSSLSLAQQRQVGARFVANVLDLTDDHQVKSGQEIAEKAGVSADELNDAYHRVHAVYVATHPRSWFTELDTLNRLRTSLLRRVWFAFRPPILRCTRIIWRTGLLCIVRWHGPVQPSSTKENTPSLPVSRKQ